jgi:hypothetical protein
LGIKGILLLTTVSALLHLILLISFYHSIESPWRISRLYTWIISVHLPIILMTQGLETSGKIGTTMTRIVPPTTTTKVLR